jgi:hypothetical protein
MTLNKGMGGHHSAAAITETWLTPPHIIQALGSSSSFDLDPCAAPMPRPWDTAQNHYTWPEQDGLKLPWEGRVWLNPPYGRAMTDWLKKMSRHNKGTALIFARTETEAYHEFVWPYASGILFLRGRLHFHYADGRRAEANSGAPSVLVAYGEEDVERLIQSGLDGAFVGLTRPVLLHMVLNFEQPMPHWREVVCDAIKNLGGMAKLKDIYKALEDHPKAKGNPHFREKIRQTIGRIGLPRIDDGQYALFA